MEMICRRTHQLLHFSDIISPCRRQTFLLRKTIRRSSSRTSEASLTSPFDQGPLHERYYEIVHPETIDPIQLRALQSLERLRHDLLHNLSPNAKSSIAHPITKPKHNQNPLSALSGWFGLPQAKNQPRPRQLKPPNVLGVYVHGGVGCGKTFLMNSIFYESLQNTIWEHHRQKTHFHKFMLSIHQQIHIARQLAHAQKMEFDGDSILRTVIEQIVQRGQLICFDEFQVTDVADALLLQRLFTALWEEYSCVVVATSNRSPDDLYLDGLQRDRFVPFIQELKVYCESVSMWESEQDYRLVLKQHDLLTERSDLSKTPSRGSSAKHSPRVYFEGGKDVWKEFDSLFYRLAGNNRAIAPTTLQTQGRNVVIPQASLSTGICRFRFEDLCTKALGAADYLLLGQHFHTVFVDDIPILKLEHVNWVRRFIIFVDTMYECNCKLILHAKTAAADIFQPGLEDRSTSQIDEVFAFQRTVSRLYEMSSQTYLQKQQKTMPTVTSQDPTSTTSVESKAALLSHRKAFVNVTPS
jgi:predicted ATPase